MKQINTLSEPYEAVYTINKSRFISHIYPCTTKSTADTLLQSLKKNHHKANHICYAYRMGKKKPTDFSTDAGEPSGSAGKPILGELLKNELTDVCLFVIRYFGGVKLGIRGLIDAYRTASETVISKSTIQRLGFYSIWEVIVDYKQHSYLEHQVQQRNGLWQNPEFTDKIKIQLAFDQTNHKEYEEWLNELQANQTILSCSYLHTKWLSGR